MCTASHLRLNCVRCVANLSDRLQGGENKPSTIVSKVLQTAAYTTEARRERGTHILVLKRLWPLDSRHVLGPKAETAAAIARHREDRLGPTLARLEAVVIYVPTAWEEARHNGISA